MLASDAFELAMAASVGFPAVRVSNVRARRLNMTERHKVTIAHTSYKGGLIVDCLCRRDRGGEFAMMMVCLTQNMSLMCQ